MTAAAPTGTIGGKEFLLPQLQKMPTNEHQNPWARRRTSATDATYFTVQETDLQPEPQPTDVPAI